MYVFSNLATSLDGKIATADRSLYHLGTPADRQQMQVIRRRADAILMGASTLRTHRKFCYTGGAKKHAANVILSHDLGGISPSWEFFQDPQVRRILLLTGAPSAAKLKRFARSCEIVLLPPATRKKPLARLIIAALEQLGIRKLLVEGGGGVMWYFVEHDLIDEYNLTLTPKLLGGTEAPTLVDGPGLPPRGVVNVKLVSCRKLGDELYLVYKKTGRRG